MEGKTETLKKETKEKSKVYSPQEVILIVSQCTKINLLYTLEFTNGKLLFPLYTDGI
jgi:hypothetical protein